MAGAPFGNKNAANAKLWQAAIHRALARRSKVAGREALDDLAERFLALCDESDLGAFKELGDRIDGKPAQTLGVGQDPNADPMQITRIERAIVGNSQD
jgi:hypothetical protein